MEKIARWIAKHQRFARIAMAVFWGVIGSWLFLDLGFPGWLTFVLVVLLAYIYSVLISVSGVYLLNKKLQSLQKNCDPYPYLQEVTEQLQYPYADRMKQVLLIDQAVGLRNTGEYDKAQMLLESVNIDKYAATQPVVKVIYYNNRMDICALLGRHQEASLWYSKMMQLYQDIKLGKQKDQLAHTVATAQALYCFCNQDYDYTLRILSGVQGEHMSQQVEDAMLYARACLAMGDVEHAKEGLQFVAQNGNRLYIAYEASRILEDLTQNQETDASIE